MAAALEFIKQQLKSKINSIEEAIQMYHMRASSYREEKRQICEQTKLNEANKITAEFCKLFLLLHNKQQQTIEELNNSFQIILEKETSISQNGTCDGVISNLVFSKKKVESLLKAETTKSAFFSESAQIGHLIDQDLHAIMQYQFEQFDEPSDPIEFPTFKVDVDNCVNAIQEIIFVESLPIIPPSSTELTESIIDTQSDQAVTPSSPHLTHKTEQNSQMVSTIDSQVIPTDETNLENHSVIESETESNEAPVNPIDIISHELSVEENENSGLASKEVATELTTDIESHPTKVPFECLSVNQEYKFVVTHSSSPSYLYLQLVTREFNQMIPGITEYHTHIDEYPEEAELVNPDSVTAGSYYFAKYDVDGCWYRAVILAAETEHPQKVSVYFIDYGNTDLVSIHNLRILPEKFAIFPQQAFIASLYNIKPIDSDALIITPTNDDEWTLPSMKYQWEQEVIQWVDVILDAHRSVYGYISQCGQSNHLELDLVLSTGTVREIMDSRLIPFTPSQLTLLDRDHVSLRELLISGSMGVESDSTSQLNYSDIFSLSTSNSSHHSNKLSTMIPEKLTYEDTLVTHLEYSEIFGTPRSDCEDGYFFPNIFQEESFFSCMLAATDSPDLFYVHVIHIRAKIIDEIASEIVGYMETYPCDRTPIEVKQPCLAFYTEDKLWYRGIVLEIKPNEEKYFVFFVEFGSTSWVTIKHIKPIDSKLLRFPIQAIPCRLYGIKPKNKLLWPLEAVEAFIKLSGPSTILTASMVSCEPHERIHNNVIIMKEFVINVRLYEYNIQETSLNDCLIELGYAESIESPHDTISASSISFSNSPDELDGWNPMESEFLSSRNNYIYEDDNIDLAIQGYKEPDLSRICRYYNSARGCNMGSLCKYIHTLYPKKNRQREKAIPNSTLVLALPPKNSYIHCKITSIQSPYNFYIRCPNGSIDLADDIVTESGNTKHLFEEKYPIEETEFFLLHKEIQAFYDTQAYPVLSEDYYNGEIVIVHSSEHNWYRSRVIDPGSIKVFYVDYGYTEIVNQANIRQIEKRFLFTPFQAIPCVLSGVVPIIEKLDEARERLESLATNRNFLARVEGCIDKGALCLYFLPNENEPVDCNLPCGCLNELLCNEGFYERCESKNENEIKTFPG